MHHHTLHAPLLKGSDFSSAKKVQWPQAVQTNPLTCTPFNCSWWVKPKSVILTTGTMPRLLLYIKCLCLQCRASLKPNSTWLDSTRLDTFDVSSPCILAVSTLSNSTARLVRHKLNWLDSLDCQASRSIR